MTRPQTSLARLSREISWHTCGRRFFEEYAAELIAAHRWCFIGGCNNSGTTLLKNLMAESGQFSAFGSEGQVHTNALPSGARRGHERVWTELMDELRLTAADTTEAVPRLAHDWLSLLHSPRHEMVLEKTTLNAIRMTWLQEAFGRSYFISMVRNGYAVSESVARRGGKSIERAARHWALVNRTMLQDSEQIVNHYVVTYESLVSDPWGVLQGIMDFLDLPATKTPGQQKRVEAIEDANAGSLARLSDRDMSTVRSEAGDMLEHYRY